MVRDIIPFIFWPWLFLSCAILFHRRVGSGSWRSGGGEGREEDSIERAMSAAPSAPSAARSAWTGSTSTDSPEMGEVDSSAPVWSATDGAEVLEASPGEVFSVTPTTADLASLRPPPRTLAEALDGITMPCDLAPLTGTGRFDPRKVTFFTRDADPATVGGALSDELERLGFALTPEDDRSIRGRHDGDVIRARLLSAGLNSELVMRELHPSAPEGAVVVEFELI